MCEDAEKLQARGLSMVTTGKALFSPEAKVAGAALIAEVTKSNEEKKKERALETSRKRELPDSYSAPEIYLSKRDAIDILTGAAAGEASASGTKPAKPAKRTNARTKPIKPIKPTKPTKNTKKTSKRKFDDSSEEEGDSSEPEVSDSPDDEKDDSSEEEEDGEESGGEESGGEESGGEESGGESPDDSVDDEDSELCTVTAETYDDKLPTITSIYGPKHIVPKMTNFLGTKLYIPRSFFPSEVEDEDVIG